MNKTIDINCDMGELDKVNDIHFMPFISSCNISCGAHAGSHEKIKYTIEKAVEHNLKIGAHPAYPDRANFGRKSLHISKKAFRKTIEDQLNYLDHLIKLQKGELHHIKAHGALYNDMVKDEVLMNDFLDIIKSFNPNLKIYALALPQVEKRIEAKGLEFIGEAFMDRRYSKDLTLQSRSVSGAVFSELKEVLTQIDFILYGKIPTVMGTVFPINRQTICLHSDTPNAEDWCEKIFNHIKNKGFAIA